MERTGATRRYRPAMAESTDDSGGTGGADAPIVLITGAGGAIGGKLARALGDAYRVIGLDRDCGDADIPCYEADLTSQDSVDLAMLRLQQAHGRRIASVVHLAAYFDFTGEENPLYDLVNVQGTRHLLRALQDFEVGQFVYSSTMLVHEAGVPGERIDEDTPLAPGWPYPQSKADAEAAIAEEHGRIPVVILRLAGLYDRGNAVPTLSHQIARIYERDLKSHVYAGDPRAGQAFVHADDMMAAFRAAIDRRARLPQQSVFLIGEPEGIGYQRLQDAIGRLIHGKAEWQTIELPKPLAKAGAWLEEKSEPVVPDDFDKGEKPFIRPFMIDMAADHYALNVDRARKVLGWEPAHAILDELPAMIRCLKQDPVAWYHANGITLPDWMEAVAERPEEENAEAVRRRHQAAWRDQHGRHIWGAWFNIAMATWLISSPPILGYQSPAMVISDIASGAALALLGMLSLSRRMSWARWACAGIGLWLLTAPLVFWAPTAAAYNNGTLVGMLVIGFAVLVPPVPGVSEAAAQTGPEVPPGWGFNPSTWAQRLPIIILAFVGLHLSRYMAAYQLGHVDAVWDPFFTGGAGPKNGTEEIITSVVSEAWPVPDAGLGALTYALEILVGVIGSTRRWRTMPWLVLLFGIMIVPLGVVSITFIIIQPIVIGTWCTICLIAAAAMLIQIPYSLDELVATIQFLVRRARAGRPLLRIFLSGDTDEGRAGPQPDEFARPPRAVVMDMVGGGVNLPWNLALSIVIGLWLMFTRSTLGADGLMADADHVIGALLVTNTVIALAEVARPLRFLNIPLALCLFVTPLVFEADLLQTGASIFCGLLLTLLALRRGPMHNLYGGLERFLV